MGYQVKRAKKFGLWIKALPHIIFLLPHEINKLPKDTDVTRADDQFFIVDDSSALGIFYLCIGIALFFATLFFWGESNAEIILSTSSFLIGSFYIIYKFTCPQKILILDRLNGIITFPGFLYGKAITIPFDEVLAQIKGRGYGLALLHKNKITFYDVDLEYEPLRSWSFMVWYMDKNRPLPPGKVFDPYRQKDYERRKKEGFPKPLYQSWIATPENP